LTDAVKECLIGGVTRQLTFRKKCFIDKNNNAVTAVSFVVVTVVSFQSDVIATSRELSGHFGMIPQ